MLIFLRKRALVFPLFFLLVVSANAQVYEVYDLQMDLVQKINDDHIFLLGESIRVSDKDQRLQLLNYNYEPFLELEGSSIYQYLSPWIIVEKEGKYGAYHEYGEQVMKPEYDEISTRYNELLGRKGNVYYHYDLGSKTFRTLGSFQEAWIAQNGQVIAKVPAGYLLPISKAPNKIYDDLQSVSNGTIIAQETTGYGLINLEGEYILDPILDTLKHLDEEYFYGYNENQYMLIKATDDDAAIRYSSYHKIMIKEDVILEYIHGRLRRVMKNDGILLDIMGMDHVTRIDKDHYNVYFKNGKVGLLDSKGIWQVVPSDTVSAILPGNEERYAAIKNQRYGYVNRAGKIVIPCRYEEVGKFSEGLAPVRSGSLWGYVDQNGREVVSPTYNEAGEFTRGLAIVKKDGKSTLIDRNGKELFAGYFHQVSRSDDYYYITEDGGLYGIIDPNGSEIAAPSFQSIRREGYDQIIVEKNGRFGIINESGEALLPVYYLDIIIDKSAQKILAEDVFVPAADDDPKAKKKKKRG